MTIRHFQIFKAVCDSEGVTAAAERLNITQPTVSIAIKEMEVFYNTKLFDRINRKMYITEAGELLRQYVDSMLEQYDEATFVLHNGKAYSKCRLGVNVSFAETHLASLVKSIRIAMPECDLRITAHNNEHLEALLSANQIDFAIYDSVSERYSKYVEPLFQEQMILLVSPNLYDKQSICMSTLSEMALLLREKGSGVRNCIDKVFSSYGLPQNVIMESASTISLLSLAQQGLGFVFIPRSLAEECKYFQLCSVAIEGEHIQRTYYLAYNRRKHLTSTNLTIKKIISLSGKQKQA